MCILKVFSKTQSFKEFAQQCSIPVYSVYDMGEKYAKSKIVEEFRISFDGSDLEWDNFEGQVEEAIKFLSENYDELSKLMGSAKDIYAFLDFPLLSRLDENIINQNDHLPRELISLAGQLNLGIEMSIYSKEIME